MVLGVWSRRRGEETSPSRELFLVLFFLYILVVIALTVAPMAASINSRATYNLIPLVNMFSWLPLGSVSTAEWIRFYLENILGNLFLLMPLGIFLPTLYNRFRRFQTVFLIAFLTTVLIESIQFISQYFGGVRTADVDDVILNTLGACGGFYVFKLFFGTPPETAEVAEC